MGKITRFEYVGGMRGWLWIVFCTLTVLLLPLASVHVLENLVVIEEQMENPNAFMLTFDKSK